MGNKAEYFLLGQSAPPPTLSLQLEEEEGGKGGKKAHSNVNISQTFPKPAVLISTKRKKLWQEVGEMCLFGLCLFAHLKMGRSICKCRLIYMNFKMILSQIMKKN